MSLKLWVSPSLMLTKLSIHSIIIIIVSWLLESLKLLLLLSPLSSILILLYSHFLLPTYILTHFYIILLIQIPIIAYYFLYLRGFGVLGFWGFGVGTFLGGTFFERVRSLGGWGYTIFLQL